MRETQSRHRLSAQGLFMPPPGALCFRVVRPSVRPSEAWNTLFPPVHGSVGPSDQPWPFYGMSVRPSVRLASARLSVRPSGEVSGHLLENAWREWPDILHADVSWPHWELISLWLQSVDFSNFALFWLSETGQIWGFRALHADVSWPPW